MADICAVEGCVRSTRSSGLCGMHYQRNRKWGHPEALVRENNRAIDYPREYEVWTSIKKRCQNKKSLSYRYYGARGIKICDRWNESFLAFLHDMSPFPNGMQIDRIDNDGDYCKENCRWVTCAENNRNRRSTKLTREDVIEIRSCFHMSNKETSEKYGIHESHVYGILKERKWKNL